MICSGARIGQVLFMLVVSAILGYAIFMGAQASLGYGLRTEISIVADEQRGIALLYSKMAKRRTNDVSDEERGRLALRSGELAERLEGLNRQIDEMRNLAVWPGLAVGGGYFVICLMTYARALRTRKSAAFFLSPAAIAGVREILEGPFNVEEGHVVLKHAFAAEDTEAFEALQLVTQGLLESRMKDVVLDVAAEKTPFSRFIGVIVAFALDCQRAGKNLRIVVAEGARSRMEQVGLGNVAKLETGPGGDA